MGFRQYLLTLLLKICQFLCHVTNFCRMMLSLDVRYDNKFATYSVTTVTKTKFAHRFLKFIV